MECILVRSKRMHNLSRLLGTGKRKIKYLSDLQPKWFSSVDASRILLDSCEHTCSPTVDRLLSPIYFLIDISEKEREEEEDDEEEEVIRIK